MEGTGRHGLTPSCHLCRHPHTGPACCSGDTCLTPTSLRRRGPLGSWYPGCSPCRLAVSQEHHGRRPGTDPGENLGSRSSSVFAFGEALHQGRAPITVHRVRLSGLRGSSHPHRLVFRITAWGSCVMRRKLATGKWEHGQRAISEPNRSGPRFQPRGPRCWPAGTAE